MGHRHVSGNAMAEKQRQFPEKEPQPSAEQRVLPMQLKVGDRIVDATGEYEVIGRPYNTVAGKTVNVRVQRVDRPDVTVIRSWGAHERVNGETNRRRVMVERHGVGPGRRAPGPQPRRRRPTRCAPRLSADEARGCYRRSAVLDSEQSIRANHADDPGADKQQRRGLRDRPRDVFMLAAPRGESFMVVAIALVEHRHVRHFSPPQCFERPHQIPELPILKSSGFEKP
jgi:hypothetical protein